MVERGERVVSEAPPCRYSRVITYHVSHVILIMIRSVRRLRALLVTTLSCCSLATLATPMSHQRRGTTPNQRAVQAPQQFLCQCYDCIDQSVIDPVSRALINGRHLGRAEYKEHRTRELKSGIVPALLASTAVNLTVPPMEFPVAGSRPASPPSLLSDIKLPSPPPPPSTSALNNSPLNRTSEIMADDSLQFTLEGVERTLRQYRSAEIIGQNPVVFRHPPGPWHNPTTIDDRGLNSEALALQEGVSVNTAIISHENWLALALGLVNDQLNSPNYRLKLLAKVLHKDLTEEIATAVRLKREEWERQRDAAIAAGIARFNTGVPPCVIITRKNFIQQSILHSILSCATFRRPSSHLIGLLPSSSHPTSSSRDVD
jgi:hypothetical protein